MKVIKGGFTQQPTAIALGTTVWVSEARFSMWNDATKNPDPFTVLPVARQ